MLPAMVVRALSFDLFDTLVDLHLDALPEFEFAGRKRRGTQPELFRLVSDHRGLEFDDFVQALAAVDRELRDARAAEGRELPTLERFRALVERLGLETPGLPEELTRTHMAAIRRCARTPSHHAELLRSLAGRYPLALCSNFSHSPTALAILKQFGLARWFAHVVISDAVGYRKPHRQIFARVASVLSLDPSEILHIGDRFDADVRGAKQAGMRSAWLIRRPTAAPDAQASALQHHSKAQPPSEGQPPTSIEPDWVFEDLAELPGALAAEPLTVHP